MMEEYQIEQIMLKKEKLIDQLCIVSAVPFNCFMVTWEIWNSWVKMLHFFNVLVVVDLYSLKVYAYSVRSRKQMLQKMKLSYDEVRSKRKCKRMRLQVDNKFQQVKIKDLNNENNIEMFLSSVRGCKAFAAE